MLALPAASMFSLKINAMQSPIPPFDFKRDPMARNWDQPDHTQFIWMADAVFVTPEQYEALHGYDCSNPTGCYPGKCWRRDERKFIDLNGHEYLLWFGYGKDDNHCSNNHRRLFVLKPARLVAQNLLALV